MPRCLRGYLFVAFSSTPLAAGSADTKVGFFELLAIEMRVGSAHSHAAPSTVLTSADMC